LHGRRAEDLGIFRRQVGLVGGRMTQSVEPDVSQRPLGGDEEQRPDRRVDDDLGHAGLTR